MRNDDRLIPFLGGLVIGGVGGRLSVHRLCGTADRRAGQLHGADVKRPGQSDCG